MSNVAEYQPKPFPVRRIYAVAICDEVVFYDSMDELRAAFGTKSTYEIDPDSGVVTVRHPLNPNLAFCAWPKDV